MEVTMKRNMRLIITAILLVMAVSTAQASVILSIEPDRYGIRPGYIVDVNVVVSGLVDNPYTTPIADEDALGAFDLRLTFNSDVLGFIGLTFGDPNLGDQLDVHGLGNNLMGYTESSTIDIGAVDFFEVSLDSILDLEGSQADSFTLATLSFKGLRPGYSLQSLVKSDLSDAWGNSITATDRSACVYVTEPVTLTLMILGFFGISLARRLQ
jgi:hypothetical protein